MISIITPNYNGAKYLRACLDSVANQTIGQERIELILIDDGSTDFSRAIIESYTSRIPNLITIWHDHTGKPSLLRNIGLAIAQGEYVLFLDSDDFLGKESLLKLEHFSRRTKADVVSFKLIGINRKVPQSMLNKTINRADLSDSGIYKTLGIWKMCRRSFLLENSITFDSSIGRGDDTIFFAEALLRAKKLAIISGYGFMYIRGRDDNSSITQKEWPVDDRIATALKMATVIKSFARSAKIAEHFYSRMFALTLSILLIVLLRRSRICEILK